MLQYVDMLVRSAGAGDAAALSGFKNGSFLAHAGLSPDLAYFQQMVRLLCMIQLVIARYSCAHLSLSLSLSLPLSVPLPPSRLSLSLSLSLSV